MKSPPNQRIHYAENPTIYGSLENPKKTMRRGPREVVWAEAVEFAITICRMTKTIRLFRLTVPISWHEVAACLSRRHRVRTSKLRSSKIPVTHRSERRSELESTAKNAIPIENIVYIAEPLPRCGVSICDSALEGGSFIALFESPNWQRNETGSRQGRIEDETAPHDHAHQPGFVHAALGPRPTAE
jgi:hypothetical protein